MQNTTQEGAHGAQTCRRRGFRELADDCNAKVTYHNNQVNELSKRLEDSQSLYNMSDCLTLADIQDTIELAEHRAWYPELLGSIPTFSTKHITCLSPAIGGLK
jgi:hypothetical protein